LSQICPLSLTRIFAGIQIRFLFGCSGCRQLWFEVRMLKRNEFGFSASTFRSLVTRGGAGIGRGGAEKKLFEKLPEGHGSSGDFVDLTIKNSIVAAKTREVSGGKHFLNFPVYQGLNG